eukprot:6082527-Karenia_brevis.AAC.1
MTSNVYWHNIEEVLIWTLKMNALGRIYKMYWDGLGRCLRMSWQMYSQRRQSVCGGLRECIY